MRGDWEERISELPNKVALPLKSAICRGTLPSRWRNLSVLEQWSSESCRARHQRQGWRTSSRSSGAPAARVSSLCLQVSPGASAAARTGTSSRPSTCTTMTSRGSRRLCTRLKARCRSWKARCIRSVAHRDRGPLCLFPEASLTAGKQTVASLASSMMEACGRNARVLPMIWSDPTRLTARSRTIRIIVAAPVRENKFRRGTSNGAATGTLFW
ncbi:uncharacterized protein LOC125508327 [Triticum urartu]|uniref:uncharacterized protein LOC125508327 n=1 Tax=Triticum urartu TaxID=4572 RepID=UPI0020449822|nr:uncharacterized protein LOC125508327 [Triticum urartu]